MRRHHQGAPSDREPHLLFERLQVELYEISARPFSAKSGMLSLRKLGIVQLSASAITRRTSAMRSSQVR
jgi:hypothetical protein